MRDISIPTGDSTPAWPGDTPFSCRWAMQVSRGATVNLSAITTSPHVGTHADAPLHVRDGAPASESLPVDAFLGPVLVLDVTGPARDIGANELLARVPAGTTRVLLRTGCSIADGSFPFDWPAIDAAAASALVARGLRLLGVDAPSVDRRSSALLAVHHALLDGGAVVVENLDLRAVDEGPYELIALPVRWVGLDAAPVRALLGPAPTTPAAGR